MNAENIQNHLIMKRVAFHTSRMQLLMTQTAIHTTNKTLTHQYYVWPIWQKYKNINCCRKKKAKVQININVQYDSFVC